MKIQLAISCFVIGFMMIPSAARAQDQDYDRTQPMTYVKDSTITAKIKAKLAEKKMSSLAHIRVDTDSKGAVVLRGNVSSQAEADMAVSVARQTDGVTSVTSRLKVKSD